VVVLAEDVLDREVDHVDLRAVEPDEPQLGGVLDEDHHRDVLDDRVEEPLGLVDGRAARLQRRQPGPQPLVLGRQLALVQDLP
jgi:hypothetical protein